MGRRARVWKRMPYSTMTLTKVNYGGEDLTNLFVSSTDAGDTLHLVRYEKGSPLVKTFKDTPANRVIALDESISLDRVSLFAEESTYELEIDLEGLNQTDRAKMVLEAMGDDVADAGDDADKIQLVPQIKQASKEQVGDDVDAINATLERFRKKKLRDCTKEGDLNVPDEEHAGHMCLSSYPEIVKAMRIAFKCASQTRSRGALLAFSRNFLREHGYLADMLRLTYPHLNETAIQRLCGLEEGSKCFVHIDHWLAVCPDEPFHFVAMVAPANIKFGYAMMPGAKSVYVSEAKAEEMELTAEEFMDGFF